MSLESLEKILDEGVAGYILDGTISRLVASRGIRSGGTVVFEGFEEKAVTPFVGFTSLHYPKRPFKFDQFTRASIPESRMLSHTLESSDYLLVVYSFRSKDKASILSEGVKGNAYAIYGSAGLKLKNSTSKRRERVAFEIVMNEETYEKAIPFLVREPRLLIELFKKKFPEEFSEQVIKMETDQFNNLEKMYIGEWTGRYYKKKEPIFKTPKCMK